MSASNIQILEAYEVAGLTPEQISDLLGWEIEAIKTVLLSTSKKFYDAVMLETKALEDIKGNTETPNPKIEQTDNNANEKPLFDTYEVNRAKQAIASLIDAEDDHIKLMSAKFVINEAKGRHDIKSLIQPKISISIINDRMLRAKQVQQEAIEVAAKVLQTT